LHGRMRVTGMPAMVMLTVPVGVLQITPHA
jgi:hypothetical protein